MLMNAIYRWWKETTFTNSHLTIRERYSRSHTEGKKKNIAWHKMCLGTLSHTHHLLSDGVVRRLEVAEHLGHDLLGIAAIAHGVQ